MTKREQQEVYDALIAKGVITQKSLAKALKELLDERLSSFARLIMERLPNKDDYVTKVEFEDFKMAFHDLQDSVMKLYDLVHTEVVIANREFARDLLSHEERIQVLEEVNAEMDRRRKTDPYLRRAKQL
jgi:hypothetical protein